MNFGLAVALMDRKKVVIILSILLVMILGAIGFILFKDKFLPQGENKKDDSVKTVATEIINVEDSGIDEIISELNKGTTVVSENSATGVSINNKDKG